MFPTNPFTSLVFVATLICVLPALGNADPQYSALWGREGDNWSPDSRLPDFSFAGYHFGEGPLPDVAIAANVREFGATGDGEHDDTQAFKDAIEQTKSGAIFVPAGRYVITDILWITKPNLVLRGAGPDETTLYCPKPLEEIKPNTGATTEGRPTSNYSWSGGIVWVRGSRETHSPRAVTSEANRGERVINVASTAGLSPGQRVYLEITDDADLTLIDHLYAGDPGDTTKLVERGAITTTFVSRITSIEGKRVTLERTLPFDVRASWKPTLRVFDPDVIEVGIEEMSFEFPVTPYEGHFTELGYNAIAINRATDCWVRNVHIRNADSGVFLSGTFCTLDGVVLESDRPLDPNRLASGHHGLQPGVDCLFQNFDFRTKFVHDVTVDSDDCRNVIKNGRGTDLTLDHHKRVPYANLFCNIDAGAGLELWRCGGGRALGKHGAAWNTFWNIRAAQPLTEPDANFGPPLMNFVGLHTEQPTHTDPAGRWWEAIPPERLYPQDLHAAQLDRRLARKRGGSATGPQLDIPMSGLVVRMLSTSECRATSGCLPLPWAPMILSPGTERRTLHTETLSAGLVVVGGGLAGTCAAIAAARAGIKVVLVQDRPVLGGNASSEVRLWILGATSHMGNNNRWAREGGIVDEILVENTFRNPEGNPLLVDVLLLEKATAEPNLTLLLNTAVHEVIKEKSAAGTTNGSDTMCAVRAFCSQNSTSYELRAPLFCDASGDGIVGFLAGAAFRMGAESRAEFGEKFAPTKEYGELLGHSLYFYSKDTGRPVQFTPPSFALRDITRIPRYRRFNAREHGCQLWWIEYGGRLDTVHDTEAIKWELWRVVYGVWDYIKNSGRFPEAANLTLEWVGTIPGKRESRRFEGDYLLCQQDIVEQRTQSDAVAFGGWSIDLHPADGVFSEKPGCNQWHAKGVYQIPYRCLYSRNITNLFLAGRIISASHVAFGSSRVMGTCACIGEAVGVAAAQCHRDGVLPRELGAPKRMADLQRDLLRIGHHIPGVALRDELDFAPHATITASSELKLDALAPDGPIVSLDDQRAMLLPVQPGTQLRLTVFTHATAAGRLHVELRQSSRPENHTPDVTLEAFNVDVPPGVDRPCEIVFAHRFADARYAFVCFSSEDAISLRASEQRVTGVLALTHRAHAAVATSAIQTPPDDIGVDSFEFWQPQRRPGGHNLALRLAEPLQAFGVRNVVNGIARPVAQPNAWVADLADPSPTLTLEWSEPQKIGRIELSFDTDFDHPMESVLWGHPERIMPFCVRRYRVLDENGAALAVREHNHETRNTLVLRSPIQTRVLRMELEHPSPLVPAALFEVRCYA